MQFLTQAEPGKPMDDPEVRAKVERILMLRTQNSLRDYAVDCFRYTSVTNDVEASNE